MEYHDSLQDTRAAKAQVQPKKSKKRLSSTRGELGKPLAASSPIRELGAESDIKPKRKKKAAGNRSSTSADEVTISSDVGVGNSTTEDSGKAKSSRKKVSGSSASPSERRKKTSNSAEASLGENSTRSPAKKSSSGRSRKSGITNTSPPDVQMVQVEINDVRSEDGTSPPQQASISVDEVDGSHEIDRSDRQRRSSSPKSRYRMADSVSPTEQQGEPEKVTVGVITKEEPKKRKKKSKAKASREKKKKTKKSTEERKVSKDKSQPSPRKVSKEQSQPSSRKASATTKETPPPEELKEEPPGSALVPQSAAISGSIESNTLTFVSTNNDPSKSSPNHFREGKKEDANTLPRSKKSDQGRSPKESVNHSTSYSNLKDETEKEFRNELREARKSQHDMPGAVTTSMTIEIDPNIKVKKSGQVKGGTPVRPSIFDQSSSPEPEEVTPISSGPVEDNILDSELKLKKSGVMMGRKTSATTRPSILDEKKKKASRSPSGKPHKS